SFVSAAGVRIDPVATVRLGESPTATDVWQLAVNEEQQPRGWLPPDSAVTGRLVEADLLSGGSLYRQGAPVRGALDAALSSPAGLGVVVNDYGQAVGTVRAHQILDVVENTTTDDATEIGHWWVTSLTRSFDSCLIRTTRRG